MEKVQHRSISRNALFSILAWLLPLGLSLVATPLILRTLGARDFGVYVLILTFISYSFAFSIGRSITKYVAQYQALGESKKIFEVISTALIINLIISAGAIILLFVFARRFVTDILQIDADVREEAVKGFYLAGLIISATILSQIFSAILQAFHRFDIYSVILVITNSVSNAGNIWLVYNGWKIQPLLIWNLVSTILTTVCYFYFCRKFIPGYKFTFSISGKIFAEVSRYNFSIIVMQIFSNALVLFERSWITRKFGPENLTLYVIPMTLSMLIHIFIANFAVVIFPLASELNALGKSEKLLVIYRQTTKVVLLCSAFLVTTLIVGRNVILKSWVGNDFSDVSAEILIIHSLSFGLLALNMVVWQIAEGFGFPHYTAALSLILLLITVPLMILFSENYAITSIAAARLIGVLIFIPAIILAEKKFFGMILWRFWLKSLTVVSCAVAAAGLLEFEIFDSFENVRLSVVLGSAGGGLMFILILWFGKYFDANEIAWLQHFKTSILKKFVIQ